MTSSHLTQDYSIQIPDGYELVWNEEFENDGLPDEDTWSYEYGFVRNNELQWYQPENALIDNGVLVITGKQEEVENPLYDQKSNDWRKNRQTANYTSASLNTRGKREFQYGIFEVRARIDTALGMWPAIWTLGVEKNWPANGETDIMEFYRRQDEPGLLANAAWQKQGYEAAWDGYYEPLSNFLENDPNWPEKFHIWKMEWDPNEIKLYMDDELLNAIDLSTTQNKDGFNPFHQPHYILLNLAIGSNGGDPSQTTFPRTYEIDYVRVFQRQLNNIQQAEAFK